LAHLKPHLAAIDAEDQKGYNILPIAPMSANLVSGPSEWLFVVDLHAARPQKKGPSFMTKLFIYILEK
jgi:hypothetical protein